MALVFKVIPRDIEMIADEAQSNSARQVLPSSIGSGYLSGHAASTTSSDLAAIAVLASGGANAAPGIESLAAADSDSDKQEITLNGGSGNEVWVGSSGDDVINGNGGDDRLFGAEGIDRLDGGVGNDKAFGDIGDDIITGGTGDDQLAGWIGSDSLDGGDGADLLAGGGGDDLIAGGIGNDIVWGDRLPVVPAGTTAEQVIAAARAKLGGGDFAIIYQGTSYTEAGLLAADHDVIIIDATKSADPNTTRSEIMWTAAQVDGVEASGKRLIAYLDVAKVNDVTLMWNNSWTSNGRASGTPTVSFLAGQDPTNSHVQLAKFWDPAWRAIVMDRVATIIDNGFSGLLLDNLIEYAVRRGSGQTNVAQAAREMRDLVIDISTFAHQRVADRFGQAASDAFKIGVNGAPFLIADTSWDGSTPQTAQNERFYDAIDAYVAENYVLFGRDDLIAQVVNEYGNRGITLLSVDTVVFGDQQRLVFERAATAAGFLPETIAGNSYNQVGTRFIPGVGDDFGPGNDQIDGGAGNDEIHGQDGNDRIVGGAGADDLEGGAGADVFVYRAAGDSTSALMDRIRDFVSGTDKIDLTALGAVSIGWAVPNAPTDPTIVHVMTAGGEILIRVDGTVAFSDFLVSSGPGDDTLSGTAGDDQYFLQLGGHDNVSGNAGNDGFYFGAALDPADQVNGGAGVDALAIQGNYPALALTGIVDVEVLAVLSGADTRFGDTANNRYDYTITAPDILIGTGGTFSVIATGLLAGEDLRFDGSAETSGSFRIFPGRGNDDLRGGAGSDGFFFGADGNFTSADRVDGGGGLDTLALRGNYVGSTAVVFANASMVNIEVLAILSGRTNEYSGALVQSGFDYDLTLADGNVAAGAGLDVIAARLGADEQLRFDGRAETNGTFRILSGDGADTLFGGSQADTLYGGLGADQLNGGGGADIYLYRSALESTQASRDSVAFASGDKFDLHLIDANSQVAGDNAFTFIGAAAFTAAGQLRAYQAGGQWFVEGDVDGNGLADLVIAVTGGVPLTVGDFVL